jgi:hypothetical protein
MGREDQVAPTKKRAKTKAEVLAGELDKARTDHAKRLRESQDYANRLHNLQLACEHADADLRSMADTMRRISEETQSTTMKLAMQNVYSSAAMLQKRLASSYSDSCKSLT